MATPAERLTYGPRALPAWPTVRRLRAQHIKSDDVLRSRMVAAWKNDPLTVEYEEKAKNLLKAELKRKGLTYAGLAEKLAAIGIQETERNLNNKISRGGFTTAFFLQCLTAIGVGFLNL